MNLCDFYIMSSGASPEEAFQKAQQVERQRVGDEASHTGSIVEKSSFIDIDTSAEQINKMFQEQISAAAGNRSLQDEYYRLKLEKKSFRSRPKRTLADKAYAFAYALVSLEDERLHGNDKPAGVIKCAKNNYLFFGFAQE